MGWSIGPARAALRRFAGTAALRCSPPRLLHLPRVSASRIGPAGCSLLNWGSVTAPSPGFGLSTTSSPGRPRRSSSRPIRSWTHESATWSGCTRIRPSTRSCCAWTRSPRSRRWNAPNRSGRCVPDGRSGIPTTMSATARYLVRRAGARHRPCHRCPGPTPPLHRVPGLPPAGRQGLPRRRLHVICDNYATHKHQKVQAWLGRHPRIQLHFTQTYASWLNLVEVFFSMVEWQALRRGDFASVGDLVAAIRGSSVPGTSAANPSSGPRTPTRFWASSTGRAPQRRSARAQPACPLRRALVEFARP
jgi:DDE superfamily endonuclease